MSIDSRKERRDRAALQAAEWMLLMQSGKATREEQNEFVDWLRESPLHVAEMLRINHVQEVLNTTTCWDQLPTGGASFDGAVIDLRPVAHDPSRLASEAGPVESNRRPRLAIAAALAACVVGALLLFGLRNASTLRTEIGEHRVITLEDGSLVYMAPASELQVHYHRTGRDLQLRKGEVFFRAHKDARRPFVVQVDDTRVRAVGTAFGVRRDGGSTLVTVVEGRVSVTAAPQSARAGGGESGQSAPPPVYVADNEQLRISDGRSQPILKVKGEMEVAWITGQLVFTKETVADVVRKFNAYNRTQITIVDPQLAERRVSGIFRTTDPESFVTFIEATNGSPPSRRMGDRIFVGAPPVITPLRPTQQQ